MSYDEPKILSSRLNQFCLKGADPGHDELGFEHPAPTRSMLENLDRMREAVEEYLIKEDFLGDAFFCEISEWIARGEAYLNDARLVLLIDSSPLYTIMNYGGDQEEFDDLLQSFGFYGELGHAWSLGIYPLPDYDYSRLAGQSYARKLQDPRWRAKADAVKRRAGHVSQDCRDDAPLEAHHCYTSLRSQREPWEYPLSAFRALCRPCHRARERSEIRMRAFVARLSRDDMDMLRTTLDSLFAGHTEASVMEALRLLGDRDALSEDVRATLNAGRRRP